MRKLFCIFILTLIYSSLSLNCQNPTDTLSSLEEDDEGSVELTEEPGNKKKPGNGGSGGGGGGGGHTNSGGGSQGSPNSGSQGGGNTNTGGGTDAQSYPDITDFTFIPLQQKLRTSNAIKGIVVGTLTDVKGGTAPFLYQLVDGDGYTKDNGNYFYIDDTYIKINDINLPSSIYTINICVTDNNNKTLEKIEQITIYPDPLSAEQEIIKINSIELPLRYIAPGSFTTFFHEGGYFHGTVVANIKKGYWMSETVVTQELYQSVMKYNPSMYNNDPALGEVQCLRPVDNLSLNEAIVFCNKLSQLLNLDPFYNISSISDWLSFPNDSINSIDTNSFIETDTANGFRIPSEHEWQWAAIGADVGGYYMDGYKKHYSGGPIDSYEGCEDYVWCFENSDCKTHEVAKKIPNELGLYDMTGNVSELINNGDSLGATCFQQNFQLQGCFLYFMYAGYPQNPHNPVGIRIVCNK
jgi:hypothetical protein